LDSDQYEGLIRQLEAESENHPAAFQAKVMFISVAAYVVLAILLVTIVLVLYFGWSYALAHHKVRIMIYLGIFTLVMLPVFYIVIRLFLTRLDPPKGRVLKREEAPRLFEVLDKLEKKLKGPPIHTVLIDRRYNAAISQNPRFGLFGGHRNYLMLGLPFLLSATPKEMLAVIAHEYGHLCGDHGKAGAWIYRQRITFGGLHQKLSDATDDSWAHLALYKILDWFTPYYNAYTFVLSRQQEYEADRTAANVAGPDAIATGLIRTALLADWIEDDYWRTFYRQADQRESPSFLPFSSMRTAFSMSYADWATEPRLATAWRENSGVLDTHPCLRERVEAIFVGAPRNSPKLPVAVTNTAAETLLGNTTKTLIDEFDQHWWSAEKPEWERRYQYVQRSKLEMAAMDNRSLADFELHELQHFALLKEEFDSAQTAKPILAYLLNKPGGPFPKPAYIYGRILLSENDDRGLSYLETAAKSDRNLVEDVLHLGYNFVYNKHGEAAAATWWRRVGPGDN
jgi:Zn-dependent protease with chaperone function